VTLATESNNDPLYNAKHREHVMTVQGLTTTAFLSNARLDSTHDLTAARADGIIDAVTEADVETTADADHQARMGAYPDQTPERQRTQRLAKLVTPL
jgi:hypothetical protein